MGRRARGARPKIKYKAPGHEQGAQPKLWPDEETLRQVSQLAGLHCTKGEAAAVLGVHRNTFTRFLSEHEEAKEAWELGRLQGKASLRRTLWMQAQIDTGQARFLAKNWLKMADKVEVNQTLNDRRPMDRVEAMQRVMELLGKVGATVVEKPVTSPPRPSKRDSRELTVRGTRGG